MSPSPLDGNAVAFPVAAGAPHELRLWYAPQATAAGTRIVSGAGLLVCLLLLAARRRGPQRAQRPDASWWAPPTALAVGGVTALTVACAGAVPASALLLIGVVAWRRPGRWLRWAPIALMALVPLAWIASNLQLWGLIAPQLVSESPEPGWLAATALATALLSLMLPPRPGSAP